MLKKIKESWAEKYSRKFIMGFQLISSLALGIFIIIVLYFALKYVVGPVYTEEEIIEAQKIGNWEFLDDEYVLKNFENISIENKNISTVTIKDKKSGNTLIVFDVGFSQNEILKTKDNIQNQLLEKYDLGKFFLISSGNKTGRIGEEFIYSAVGWGSGDSAKTGIIGSMDCLKIKKTGTNIIVFVFNGFTKYSKERALAFVNTLSCPVSGSNGGGDGGVSDEVDTDNDGLTNKVEIMLGTDPYKKDTDNDGHSDFTELQNGYSPMIPRPWDEYTSEEFIKVKKDIKYVSIDVYDKLFSGK